MGADIVGWRSCPLQKPLGKAAFLQKLKLRSYLQLVESQLPEGERESVKLAVRVGEAPQRELTYAELQRSSEGFKDGIPECATCPVSGGQTLGCYRYVQYPIDQAAEDLLFDFVCVQLGDPKSLVSSLYPAFLARQPRQGTPWHDRRGPGALRDGVPLPTLAERPTPQVQDVPYVDSAQVLSALFFSSDDPQLIQIFARFWRQVADFATHHPSGQQSVSLPAMLSLGPFYELIAQAGRAEGASLEVEG
jgi:hypothetical protein